MKDVSSKTAGSAPIITQPPDNTAGGPLIRVRQNVVIATLFNKSFDAICIKGHFATATGRFVALYAKVLEDIPLADIEEHPAAGCVKDSKLDGGFYFPHVPMPTGYVPGNVYKAVVWGWFDPNPSDSSSSSAESGLFCRRGIGRFKPDAAAGMTECEASSSSSSSTWSTGNSPWASPVQCADMSAEDGDYLRRALSDLAIENQRLKQIVRNQCR